MPKPTQEALLTHHLLGSLDRIVMPLLLLRRSWPSIMHNVPQQI